MSVTVYTAMLVAACVISASAAPILRPGAGRGPEAACDHGLIPAAKRPQHTAIEDC
ncbi:MAG TPA: hypothetical protein VFQ48_04005 [Pseudonocardiaceae bacterium]|nr:hypothetical protein [Pseudonocardiaceae bacterium]